jgi:hypothetical protein
MGCVEITQKKNFFFVSLFLLPEQEATVKSDEKKTFFFSLHEPRQCPLRKTNQYDKWI